jgi:hypothetical protein
VTNFRVLNAIHYVAENGCKCLETLENKQWEGTKAVMAKAYEGDETQTI